MSESIVTSERVEEAFKAAKQMILKIIKRSSRQEPRFVHVVVLDPVSGQVVGEQTFSAKPETLPSPMEWKRPYDEIALSKARISHRTHLPSGEVAARFPAFLLRTDTFFPGGIWHNGLSVGSSGLEAELDAQCSRRVAEKLEEVLYKFVEERVETGAAFLDRH